MMTLTYEDLLETIRSRHERSLVAVERAGAHAIVTLDDPDKLNPLSAELTVQLHDQLAALAADRTVRAIVLTGRDPAFSAGGDLRLMVETGQRQPASVSPLRSRAT